MRGGSSRSPVHEFLPSSQGPCKVRETELVHRGDSCLKQDGTANQALPGPAPWLHPHALAASVPCCTGACLSCCCTRILPALPGLHVLAASPLDPQVTSVLCHICGALGAAFQPVAPTQPAPLGAGVMLLYLCIQLCTRHLAWGWAQRRSPSPCATEQDVSQRSATLNLRPGSSSCLGNGESAFLALPSCHLGSSVMPTTCVVLAQSLPTRNSNSSLGASRDRVGCQTCRSSQYKAPSTGPDNQ